MATSAHDPAGAGVGVHSETGRLRTVMLHRPGAELLRLTRYPDAVAAWHTEMASFIRQQDPYHHLITTSSRTSDV